MNKDIFNIVRKYLLPSKYITEYNKSICLNQLLSETKFIEYDLSRKQIMKLVNKTGYMGDIIKCKNYTNAKYYYDKPGWLIVIKN